MPRELIATAPRTPTLREYDEPALGPSDVRIRTEFASPKHGTELVAYRNDPVFHRPYDREWGAVIPRDPSTAESVFPIRLGNMAVGVVTETGSEVQRFRVGDRVFGHLPIRETHTLDETRVDPLPEGLSAEAAVCLDPAIMAFVVRDAPIKLGDRVAVFGMGAIGLMAVQWARLAGAEWIVAIDPLAQRRDLALALGADAVVDPLAGDRDAGMAIRRLTRTEMEGESERPVPKRVVGGYWEQPQQWHQLGVDVAVEVSGSAAALHHAIRATRYGGTICVVSFYGRDAAGLYLGDEFHINRLQLVSARAESLPLRDYPGWTLRRLVEVSLRALVSGRLRTEGIITPIVDFEDAADAYRRIDEHPEESIKLGIRFP